MSSVSSKFKLCDSKDKVNLKQTGNQQFMEGIEKFPGLQNCQVLINYLEALVDNCDKISLENEGKGLPAPNSHLDALNQENVANWNGNMLQNEEILVPLNVDEILDSIINNQKTLEDQNHTGNDLENTSFCIEKDLLQNYRDTQMDVIHDMRQEYTDLEGHQGKRPANNGINDLHSYAKNIRFEEQNEQVQSKDREDLLNNVDGAGFREWSMNSSRKKHVFSRKQVSQLEEKFMKQRYLKYEEKKDLAEKVGLTPMQVKIWFQNRRYRLKKKVLKQRSQTFSSWLDMYFFSSIQTDANNLQNESHTNLYQSNQVAEPGPSTSFNGNCSGSK